MAGILCFARAHDWCVQTVAAPESPADVRRLVDFWRPVGCIVEASGGIKVGPKPFGTTPVVFLDQDPSAVRGQAPLVRHDPVVIATLAARELMARDGHFAFMDWYVPVCWATDKRMAFQELLSLHGHACHVFTPSPSEWNHPIMFQKRLRKWVSGLPVPCGVFAVNDLLGAEVIAAAAACGRAIPDDISVIGVDDNEAVCENTHPSLSSVQPDFELSGHRAAELLEGLIDNPSHPPPEISFVPPVRVVRRQSTRLFPLPDAKVAEAVEHIRRNISAGVRARDVAAIFPCSRRLAEIRFRRATGRSFLEEIDAARLEATFDLLRRPEVALSAVADRCGWPSGRIFHRRFKASTGFTPGDWRRRHAVG